eukprot:TRINITY_DN7603_c2_g1_i1.p1 TRINITY_DN7603_c2_g1~~TRINITY_DN7603_c2_g1_i1.p1  ORF type:complete len:953 (-),score=255.17 TRINITY_DN7603_c2_g1_i1:132-2990(-)
MEVSHEDDADGNENEGHSKKKKVKPGSFQGLGLSQATYKAIMRMGYKMPTPIQRKTIPTILEGQDMVAMARTGSGKTAAFLIPMIERLKVHSVSVGVRGVVLSPTRELAMQTAKFGRQLGKYSGLRNCLLVGGQAMEAQFEHLANNPDIVIATPGRLMHHILEAELSLSRVEMLVFDEADRLFELGFAEQLQKILDAAPSSRQCLLFSATLPAQLVAFTRSGVKDPAFVRLDVETTISENLELQYLFIRKDEKLAAAISVLRRMHQEEKTTIMFVATKHHVEFFGELLKELGLTVAIVYGSMDQVARQDEIHKFRKKKARILVTTDVAARGVDIPLLDHVLNFDFPPSAKLFVHRCGRTARAGRNGLAVSLVTLEDLPYTVELMTFLGHKIRVATNENVAEFNEAESQTKIPILGAIPPVDHEVETLEKLLEEEGTLLHSSMKSMMASYHLYNKTRPSASKSSVSRSKELLEECGGPARLQGLRHPAYRDEGTVKAHGSQVGAAGADLSFIQELRGFRPKFEKVGNVLSESSMRRMEQAKLDAVAVAATRVNVNKAEESAAAAAYEEAEAEATTFGGSSSSSALPNGGSSSVKAWKKKKGGEAEEQRGEKRPRDETPARVRKGPRLSKAARKRLKAGKSANGAFGAEDAGEFDVTVDGADWGGEGEEKSQKKKGKDSTPQFYLSVARDLSEEAKEKGLDMEEYQMDLLPDDSTDIQKAKSVMRWDAKKKKYLPTMVSVDGKALKGQRKNESGKKVRGEAEKSNIYQKWAKATKKRIQKVGELEDVKYDALGKLQKSKGKTVEFGADGEVSGYGGDADDGDKTADGRVRKPVVPFHGKIDEKHLTHKQKRMLKKRSNQGGVTRSGGTKELKTPQQMQQEKKKKGLLKLKQKPHLRAQKAKESKEARKKLHEDRQMKYGARTRAKMLIIEGPRNQWQHKKKAPVNGYGRGSHFF